MLLRENLERAVSGSAYYLLDGTIIGLQLGS